MKNKLSAQKRMLLEQVFCKKKIMNPALRVRVLRYLEKVESAMRRQVVFKSSRSR